MEKMGQMAKSRLAVAGSLISAVVIGSLQCIGCASKPPRPSGFLGDYSALRPVPEDSSILYYELPNVPWKRYTKLMLDPVAVVLSPDAKREDIPPEELRRLADYFRSAAIEAVADRYPVVYQPGPDVLRIRAAITNIIPAYPLLNLATTATVMFPVDMGGACMEVEFLDSMTGQRLAAAVSARKGSFMSPKDVLWRAYTRWGHAKSACERWAKELRVALDEVH